MTKLAVSKWGNSLAIRMPKSLAEDLGLKNGSEMSVSVKDGQMVARPIRKRPRLSELVKRITPENRHSAVDWGKPVGKEVW